MCARSLRSRLVRPRAAPRSRPWRALAGGRRRGARRPRSSPRSRPGREEDGRLHELVEPAAGRLEDRAGGSHDLLGLLLIVSPTISRVRAAAPSWPDTNTRSPAASPASTARPGTARAPPRCGSGSSPPRSLLPRDGPARLAERDAERLEDRLEHVLRRRRPRSAACARQPGARRELARKRATTSSAARRRAASESTFETTSGRPTARRRRRKRLVGGDHAQPYPRRRRVQQRRRAPRRARAPRPPPPRPRRPARPRAAARSRRSARAASRWSSTGSPVATAVSPPLDRARTCSPGLRSGERTALRYDALDVAPSARRRSSMRS